ncbi:MAG: TIGR03086 family metal-binding protein [Dehalococcoidia bacterium]
MAQGPNPIEIYQGVAQALIPVFGSVNEGQLSSSTPCIEWTVKNLINHNFNVQTFLHTVLTGGQMDPSAMSQVDGELPSEGAEAALKAITDKVISTANSMDLTTNVQTPFGEMPAGNFIMIPMLDMVIHRWDLASAIGQNNAIDASLAEICVGVLSPEALAGGRQMGAFGPEVVIPTTGTIQERLLGSVGRTP